MTFKRRAVVVTMLLTAMLFGSTRIVAEPPITYEYFVDSSSGKAYSILYESGPVRFAIQFPGRNPHDDFLYRGGYTAFLWIASKQPYSIRNLWFGFKRDGKELIPTGSSFLNDKRKWKKETIITRLPSKPREMDLDAEGAVLIGVPSLWCWVFASTTLRSHPFRRVLHALGP